MGLARKLRVGAVVGTLVAGTIAVTWKDPDTFLGTSAVTVQLEYAPAFVWAERTTGAGTARGVLVVTAITANGCTLTAQKPADGTTETNDTSTFRVYAVCRAEDL